MSYNVVLRNKYVYHSVTFLCEFGYKSLMYMGIFVLILIYCWIVERILLISYMKIFVTMLYLLTDLDLSEKVSLFFYRCVLLPTYPQFRTEFILTLMQILIKIVANYLYYQTYIDKLRSLPASLRVDAVWISTRHRGF